MKCRKTDALPFKLATMALLPLKRLKTSRPFQHVGIDYAGPFNVSNGKIQKRWICLITCLATRAVHLGIVSDLSEQSFLNAYKRFTARRGEPKTVVSVNETHFKAAAEKVGAYWTFITPHAPWKGGIYEGIIGLFKTAFRETVAKKLLTAEELLTITIEIESILNSRITPVNDDTNDVLRPIDFLLPQVLQTQNNKNHNQFDFQYHNSTQLNTYFRKLEKTLDDFWTEWQKSYLQFLRTQPDVSLKQPNKVVRREPEIEEIVIVADDNLSRAKWELGKIVNTHRNNRGQVTTAT